jgi:SAM-dependent methyltransferase
MIFKNKIKNCIICSSSQPDKSVTIYQCPKCGLLTSGQGAGFGNPIKGMSKIAFQNYSIVANALESVMSLPNTKILDVGCAEGGFTEILIHKGAYPIGLEPDKLAARDAIKKNLPIELVSFESFPERAKEFNAIVFNDVFEHMEDPLLVVQKCSRMLKNKGFILINIPVSTGFIFRIVKALALLGIKSPYRRMWAEGLCSPHIYFYSEVNLKILFAKYNFELVNKGRLISLSSDGMYQRVRSTYNPLPAFVISVIANLFVFISRIFPADVIYLIFQKNE